MFQSRPLLRWSIGLLALACGTAAPRARAGDEPATAASRDADATGLLEQFRKGWTASRGHMRPMDDPGWKVRMSALCGLVAQGPGSVGVLAEALEDSDAEVRAFAAQALGFLADASVRESMDRLLADDPSPAVRLYAADALGMMGRMTTKELYENAAAKDAQRNVRQHVGFALERGQAPLAAAVQRRFAEFDLAEIDRARLGEPAPDFQLTDALDQTYRLSDFRGKKNVVLVFIYGDT